MDAFLKYLFWGCLTSILIVIGWYSELSISKDSESLYSVVHVVGFVLLVTSTAFLIFWPTNRGHRLKSIFIFALTCCLSFFSGAQLFRTDIPSVNDYLELTANGFRKNFVDYGIYYVLEIIGSEEKPPELTTPETQDEPIIHFDISFNKKVLVKFKDSPAAIVANFPNKNYDDYVRKYPDLLAAYNASMGGSGGSSQTIDQWGESHFNRLGKSEGRRVPPKIVPLVRTDADHRMRPFAFPDSNLVLAYSESEDLIKHEAPDVQTLSLHRLNESGREYSLMWKTRLKTPVHHWGDVHNRKIYIPGRKFISVPNEFSDSFELSSYSNCKIYPSRSETIEVFSLDDGKHLQSIEILPLLSQSPDEGFARYLNDCQDPLHLNDVQILRFEHRSFFPEGKEGDMLISMRSINTLALLDKDNGRLKWSSSLFHAQHSPRITNYGTILVFDNRASNAEHGATRITELDIATEKIVGIWEGTEKTGKFESKTAGRIQLVDDRIFVQESVRGRLFQLMCAKRPISLQCQKTMILKRAEWNKYLGDMFIAEVLE